MMTEIRLWPKDRFDAVRAAAEVFAKRLHTPNRRCARAMRRLDFVAVAWYAADHEYRLFWHLAGRTERMQFCTIALPS